MRTDLLLRLADLLEADAANPQGVKFDLSAWAYNTVTGDKFKNEIDSKATKIPVNCGTAACAWGLAAISGIFADDGVGFNVSYNGTLVPTYQGDGGFNAAEAFFEVDETTTHILFDLGTYTITTGAEAELEVAKRIRELVAVGNLDRLAPTS